MVYQNIIRIGYVNKHMVLLCQIIYGLDLRGKHLSMTILQLDSRNVFGTTGSGNQKKQWIGPKLIKLNSK